MQGYLPGHRPLPGSSFLDIHKKSFINSDDPLLLRSYLSEDDRLLEPIGVFCSSHFLITLLNSQPWRLQYGTFPNRSKVVLQDEGLISKSQTFLQPAETAEAGFDVVNLLVALQLGCTKDGVSDCTHDEVRSR